MAVTAAGLRVGLFGGTFDPVHQGHLELARHVLGHCRLDRLLCIPALLPPHKQQPVASFGHRLAMLEAALHACPDMTGRVFCSRIEENLPAPSFTVNTVQALIEQAAHRYSLIIGADSLLDLPHWHRIETLLRRVDLIVVRRPGIDAAAIDRALADLPPGFVADPDQQCWFGQQGQRADYLDAIELPVSSSAIRKALAHGQVPTMLPKSVLAYIRQHHLYGWQEGV